MKMKARVISLVMIVMISAVFLTACVAVEYTYEHEYEYNYSTPEIEWTDSLPDSGVVRPTGSFAYPKKPDTLPEDDGSGSKVSSWTAYGEYDIEETANGADISFGELADWSYVYAEIQNYSYDRRNIRVDYVGAGADRITVQAIYYEMYDANYVPITVYMGVLKEGSGSFSINFHANSFPLLDGDYNVIEDSDLSENTLIGLVMFIDSNPMQSEPFIEGGGIEFTNVRFLANNNSQLNIERAPSVKRMYARDADAYTLSYDEGYGTAVHNSRLSVGEYLILPIIEYAAGDSTQIELKLKNSGFVMGTSASRFSEIRMEFEVPQMFESYWLKEAQTETAPAIYSIGNNASETTVIINFGSTRPQAVLDGSAVDNFFIKNYTIKAIRLYYNSNLATTLEDGSITILSARFL